MDFLVCVVFFVNPCHLVFPSGSHLSFCYLYLSWPRVPCWSWEVPPDPALPHPPDLGPPRCWLWRDLHQQRHGKRRPTYLAVRVTTCRGCLFNALCAHNATTYNICPHFLPTSSFCRPPIPSARRSSIKKVAGVRAPKTALSVGCVSTVAILLGVIPAPWSRAPWGHLGVGRAGHNIYLAWPGIIDISSGSMGCNLTPAPARCGVARSQCACHQITTHLWSRPYRLSHRVVQGDVQFTLLLSLVIFPRGGIGGKACVVGGKACLAKDVKTQG